VKKLAARKTAVASAPQKAPELREAAPKDAVAKEQAATAKTNPVRAREQPGAQVATKSPKSEESGPQVAAGGAAERPSSDEQEDGVDLGDVLDLAGQVGGGLVKGAQTAGKVAQTAGKAAVVVGGAAVKTAETVVDVTAKVAEVLPQMQQGMQDGARAIAPVVEGVGQGGGADPGLHRGERAACSGDRRVAAAPAAPRILSAACRHCRQCARSSCGVCRHRVRRSRGLAALWRGGCSPPHTAGCRPSGNKPCGRARRGCSGAAAGKRRGCTSHADCANSRSAAFQRFAGNCSRCLQNRDWSGQRGRAASS